MESFDCMDACKDSSTDKWRMCLYECYLRKKEVAPAAKRAGVSRSVSVGISAIAVVGGALLIGAAIFRLSKNN